MGQEDDPESGDLDCRDFLDSQGLESEGDRVQDCLGLEAEPEVGLGLAVQGMDEEAKVVGLGSRARLETEEEVFLGRSLGKLGQVGMDVVSLQVEHLDSRCIRHNRESSEFRNHRSV